MALTTQMRSQWQMTLLWGVCVGTGTGVTSMVLAAVVATRWFDARRGTGARRALGGERHGTAGLPADAGAASSSGTAGGRPRSSSPARPSIVFAVVLVFMRDRPEDLGLRPLRPVAGRRREGRAARRWRRFAALRLAIRSRAFWVLAGTFFVCGASTNGLIGTHLIAACHDYGIPQMRSAQLLALMGIFDIVGTTASGWLTDRYSSRHLLFGYYTLRGLSLLYLPFTLAERSAASASSRCSTGSTGSPPCLRPCG